MKQKKPCVREWLAAVDPDLEVYAARFEDLEVNVGTLTAVALQSPATGLTFRPL